MSIRARLPARRRLTLMALAAAVLGMLTAMPQPADAKVRFGVSIGFGLPLYGWGYHPYGWHDYGWHRPWRPYYYRPRVVVVPPPAYYEPPPAYYQAPPAYGPPPAHPPRLAVPAGSLCRPYRSTIYIDGVAEASVGTACLQPDGSWRLMN